jgi:clan AA aspartic protease (TIGR02281 family)
VLAAVAWLQAGAGVAEVYRWTDASGRLHFTEDLHRVPPAHRAEAEASAERDAGPSRVQRIESPPARRAEAPLGARGSERIYTIPVERAGLSMQVTATLNGSVRAPFIIDTGASDVVIPGWVAEQLGVEIDETTRTQFYQTANGVVETPVVTLDSIDLGGAEAHDVAASVSEGMPVGLLGLSFFNRFSYHVDPARGVVTLRPNGLVDEGVIRGGRSESEWRTEFRQLRSRIARVEARRVRLTPAHTRRLDELDAEIERLEEQIDALDAEADRARVPHGWRE